MARTVVPPAPGAIRGARDDTQADSIPEKLVKYVPAETLALFVPAAALLGKDRDGLLILVLVVAALGTVGYLWNAAKDLPEEKQPLAHFYVLAVLAFAAWALATSGHVADLVGADETTTSLILLLAVFVIPLADSIGNRLLARK
jgi:hypothetical protein